MSTQIHVGAGPQAFSGKGLWLDGQTARSQRATLSVDEDTGQLVITTVIATHHWPLSEIRRVPDQADRSVLILARTGGAVPRLAVDDPETARILRARCPHLRRRPKPRGLGRLGMWAVGALASVGLILTLLIPLLSDQLATLLPSEGEEALGQTTLTQIRRVLSPNEFAPLAFCENPDGLAALSKLTARVNGGIRLPHKLSIKVLDHPMINAFALPGGHITLFSGLIDAAETPAEVAAVYAHELGHVVARDPTRIALRSAGSIGVLGLLLGDFAGGAAVLFLVERLIAANYSQDAEAAADGFATTRLQKTDIDPAALGDFFERLRSRHGDTPELLEHFMPHPSLVDRIESARAIDPADQPRDILTEDEWRDLRAICTSEPSEGS